MGMDQTEEKGSKIIWAYDLGPYRRALFPGAVYATPVFDLLGYLKKSITFVHKTVYLLINFINETFTYIHTYIRSARNMRSEI